VSLEAGRALQRTLDAAPSAAVAVKAESATRRTADAALATAATIKLSIAALPIGADLVARRLQELRKLISMTEPRVRAPVEAGDEVEVDILGYVDGKVFLAQQNAWLDVRPNVFLPGLLEAMVGLTPPESAVFQLRIPEHYPVAEQRGKVAAFAVTIRRARRRVLPDIDDPIFIQLTGRKVKTRAELEAKVADELAEERGRLCVDEAKVGLLRSLYVAIGVNDAVPDDLVDEELRKRWKAHIGDAMALQGVAMDDQKKSLAEFSTAHMRAESRRTVWEQRCLEAVADAHGLEATESEVHKIITELSPDIRRGDVESVLYQHAAISKDIVKNLRLHRALLILLAKVTVTFDATPVAENRIILQPLPIAGSGSSAGSGAPKASGEMSAARGLKRPPTRAG
jgi:FKBP-type peptidyl-prolyl cis-trans isomerase (trigger factor)